MKLRIPFFILIFVFGCLVIPASAQAETKEEAVKSLEILEDKTQETQKVLKQKEEEIETVKKEAEKVIEEKKVIEKEAQLLEEAAIVAKKESEVLKKEAEVTKDPEAARKARELEEEAANLEKKAEVSKDKLSLAESKAKLAETTVERGQTELEKIKKELLDLKKEKSIRRSWLEKLTTAVIMLISGLVLLLILNIGIRRLVLLITRKERDAIRESATVLRIKTLSRLFHWLAAIIVVLAVAYLVLENYGVSVAPLLAGVSVAGLAFGFGGQYLIRDIINGVFILFEGQYRINDVVQIGDNGGLVEDINLRITTLRDLSGRVIIIPNGEVKTVINFTKGYSQALFDLGVAYKENVDHVMQVIKDLGAEMRKDPYFGRVILDDLEMLGVDAFADSQVTIKFRIKTLPIKQWDVMREFNRRIKNRFDELGIEIPFPHHTVYWGQGPDNDWFRALAGKVAGSGPANNPKA